MSRMSVSRRTREGMLLTAPGNTSQTPTVPTVSKGGGFCRRSSARINSARHQSILASRHQLAAGMTAFAFDEDAQAGGRSDMCDESDIDALVFNSGPCSICSSTN